MKATTTAKTYDRQTASFLAVVGQNMPEISGDVMQGWIENPKALQKALRTALCPPETTTITSREFATWKTITIGTKKSVEDLSRTLTDNGFQSSERANDILKKTTLASVETEIELVEVSFSDLGLKEATSRRAVYARAKKLGLDLVPAEVGPQLRLQYADQPMGELIVMAMKSIASSDRSLRVFCLTHCEEGKPLFTVCGSLASFGSDGARWVFARRK